MATALFLVLTGLFTAGDLVSKDLAFRSLLDDPQLQARMDDALARGVLAPTAKDALRPYTRPVGLGVKFSLSTNEGVAFGFLMPRWLIACMTVVTVGLVFYFFATSPACSHGVHVALSLIFAGALGNLYDRLFGRVTVADFEPIRYQVRDFIDCSNWYYPWVFNVADAWLVIGVGLMVLCWWRAGRTAGASPAQSGKND